RRANRDSVLAAIGEVLMSATAAQWVRRLEPLGIVAAEVGTLAQALDSDLARSRSLIVPLGDGEYPLRAVGSPLKFDGFEPRYGLPPLLDEHHAELGRKEPA
ncbi:MAG TPA: CoA transferase, partial [Burkholderiaceae bacterium]|nr:CoA transferase [Burkholderiaceae bacterium]